ncbi:MAG: ion transporter [candidate division KSB1 bacterium]|mgnify:CR=1 FL=1
MKNFAPEAERARVALQNLVESGRTQSFLTAVILINAITLGLETSTTAMASAGTWLKLIDRFALAIFVLELSAKLLVYGPRFFRGGWNVFDFVIVAISLLPATGNLSVLRAFRVLRVLRMFSVVPKLRSVVQALLEAIPSMVSIIVVLMLVYYVTAVLAHQLFGARFGEWFGTIGRAMYSLFEIMTFDNWSSGIVRPVMEVYPWAWIFFLPFIIVTSFAVLNLFIAIIVNTMQSQQEAERQNEMAALRVAAHDESETLSQQIAGLREEVLALRALLQKRK